MDWWSQATSIYVALALCSSDTCTICNLFSLFKYASHLCLWTLLIPYIVSSEFGTRCDSCSFIQVFILLDVISGKCVYRNYSSSHHAYSQSIDMWGLMKEARVGSSTTIDELSISFPHSRMQAIDAVTILSFFKIPLAWICFKLAAIPISLLVYCRRRAFIPIWTSDSWGPFSGVHPTCLNRVR